VAEFHTTAKIVLFLSEGYRGTLDQAQERVTEESEGTRREQAR